MEHAFASTRRAPEVASLAAPGTRAAGPWGRPRPPPECAPHAQDGQRRACIDPPSCRPARIPSVLGFQFARLPPDPPAPLPRPAGRARRGRRRGEELKIWNPGNLGSPRTRGWIPGFQIPSSPTRARSPGHVRHASRGGEARARGAVFQAPPLGDRPRLMPPSSRRGQSFVPRNAPTPHTLRRTLSPPASRPAADRNLPLLGTPSIPLPVLRKSTRYVSCNSIAAWEP